MLTESAVAILTTGIHRAPAWLLNIMKLQGNLFQWVALAGAAIGLLLVSGCSKESGSPSVAGRVTAAEPAPPPESSSASAPAEQGAELDSQAPEATAAGLPRVTAEQLRDAIRGGGKKATLVNAWASWCGPCRRELPMLQALAANLKPQGVEIVLVSVDEEKDEQKAVSYLKDNAITLRSYLASGSLGAFKQGINPRWPGMLPASFLFDGGARLVHFWGGEAFENELTPTIEAFVAGKPIEAETRYGLLPGKVE